MIEALMGSASGVKLKCSAWYNGRSVVDDLAVPRWSMKWTDGPQTLMQGQASFTFHDDIGKLAPWGWDEPLAPGGAFVQTRFVVGDDSVELGRWLISKSKPEEMWRLAGPAESPQWVSGGATIPVEATEFTTFADEYVFLAPESPPNGATVISEVKRLLAGVVDVFVDPAIVDVSVPSSMTYSDNRLATVYDLVDKVGKYRMTGDGRLWIYPYKTTGTPTVVLRSGPGGALVAVKRELDRTLQYNAVKSTSVSTTAGITATAKITDGPLKWGPPFGYKPLRHTAVADTQAGVQADADTILAQRATDNTTTLEVYCTPDPRVMIGDLVQVANPMINGNEYPLVGRVKLVELSGSSAGLDQMHLSVVCNSTDVQNVSMYVRTHS